MSTVLTTRPDSASVTCSLTGDKPRRRRRRRLLWLALAATICAATILSIAGLNSGAPSHRMANRIPEWAPLMAGYFAEIADPAGVHLKNWREVPSNLGPRDVADLAGVGLIQFNPKTHEVDEVIFSNHLGGAASTVMPGNQAVGVARDFAVGKYLGFSALTFRAAEFIDHHEFAEYRITWQARAGRAWLPSMVAIGINARTGQVAYYSSTRLRVTISTVPDIGATAAARAALTVANLDGSARTGAPELTVQANASTQQLVWSVPVLEASSSRPHIARDVIVWVDAHTGQARVVART